jgi:hypothetical protein
MSDPDASERRRQRQLRRRLQALTAVHDEGGVLAASRWAPEDPRVRQTISLRRTEAGTTRVVIVYHEPTVWDEDPLEESEHEFDDLFTALRWIESRLGVASSDLSPLRSA